MICCISYRGWCCCVVVTSYKGYLYSYGCKGKFIVKIFVTVVYNIFTWACHQFNIILNSNNCCYCIRKVQRIIHIPFFKAECVISEAEHIQIDDKLVQTRGSLSSCIGYLISLREALTSPISRNFIGENLMPFISQHMPSVHYRLKKCYALILASARLVSCNVDITWFMRVCKCINCLKRRKN
jgi:hypothetical protein